MTRSPARTPVTQLNAQIRRVGREVAGAKDLIATECTRLAALTGQGYDQPGKPRIAWDDPAAATTWSPCSSATPLRWSPPWMSRR